MNRTSKADLILKNANVHTMEPGQPGAGLVAIKGDRIWLVGANAELEQVKGSKTKVIDCRGKTVVPGFNDAHCHLFSFIRKLFSIDLGPARSMSDIKEAVRRAAQNTPPGKWLSGTGYNEFYLAEKRHPNRWDLDEVAPDHPVVLAHRSLHACVLNSLALSLAGINMQSEAPEGGVIERDLATGEPTGLLFEMLGYIRSRVIPPLSDEEVLNGVTLAGRHYLSLGITSIGEATVTNGAAQWSAFRRFKDMGKLSSRMYLMFGAEALTEFQEAGLTTGSGDYGLRLGGVKVVLSEATGQLQPSQDELNGLVLMAQRAGFGIAIHAVERSTVEAAIKALEYASSHLPPDGRRPRIEHCSQCPPDLRRRLSRLQAVVVSQPPFLYYSGERYLAEVPPHEQEWLYPFRSLLESGVVVAASSDSPVVPDSPLVGIYGAVTRRAESGQVVLPQESLSVNQALEMYTVNAAYASFEERAKGSLAPGKLADMVVLSDDPVKSPPEGIKDIKVEMTIIGGRVVWEG